MNWRKEERTDGKTSSLPAVCRTDPDYSGDGLVWRFLDMEISRREETMAVGGYSYGIANICWQRCQRQTLRT